MQIEFESSKQMALTNLILTVAGVSAVILLMRSDVKQSASIFKRNVRQIRHWLEEESASAAKYVLLLPHTHTHMVSCLIMNSCVDLFLYTLSSMQQGYHSKFNLV